MTATSSRLLVLLSLLQARRDWPGQELAARLEVSSRTVRRDVDRLRSLGYPVDALPGPAGGYRLQAGAAMPPLLLDDDEAVAIAVGLRTAAGTAVTGIEETSLRALVKLEQVLPGHLRRRVAALGAAMAPVPGQPGPTVDAGTLATIAGACRDRLRVVLRYRARDGAVTRRDVEPHSLVHLGRRWYLVAWDTGRSGWRTFRLDRCQAALPTSARFAVRELPASDPVAYVAERLSEAPYRYQARVTLHAPAAEIRRRVPHLWGRLEPLDDCSCEYRTGDDSLDWLALRIGMLGVPFRVDEPPELAQRFLALAERFAGAASATG